MKKKIQSIHFVGIKGVGMTPLAIIAKEAGMRVSGCDIGEEFITDKSLKKVGITPLVGFSEKHVDRFDLVITTGAHGGFDNKEVQYAKYTGIPVITQGEAVGEFMKGAILKRKGLMGISVAGSHGKTTTTAMLATIFKENRLDPSFVIGTGDVPSLNSPGHYGKGKYFITEADEYATEPKYDKTPKFLWQHPKMAIFTNIEFDHPDLYGSLEEIRSVFLTFAKQLPKDGLLVTNGDDSESKKLLKEHKVRAITFGTGPQNDFVLKKVSISDSQTFFWLEAFGTSLGEFALQVVGEHNALNAIAVVIVALEVGLRIDDIKVGLQRFTGTKRRFEYVGKLESGAVLFDDYAHHPTEIKKTLEAMRARFKNKKIVCIFQPHTYSRTKILFDEFITSFSDANTVIISNIYPSLREKPDPTVSSKQLVDTMNLFYKRAVFLPELPDVVEYIEQKGYGEDTVIVTMGAGDIYKISKFLISKS